VFRSRLEDIVPAEELLFEPTPGFGYYAPWLKHAVAHPAKMNTWLLEYLIRAFTEPCDTVLDPMAGSGNTGTVAALLGRNAVQVELERKFWEWMEKARENVEKTETATPKGRIVNICGDARRLSELLSQADAAITSPPYSNIAKSKEGAISPHMQGLISKRGIPVKEFAHNVEKLKEAVKIAQAKIPFKYSDNPRNIGNLPHGDISAVITSPPYSECPGSVYEGLGERVEKLFKEGKITREQYEHFKGRKAYFEEAAKPYPQSNGQIASLPHGDINVVITSPPHGNTYLGGGDPEKRKQRLIRAGHDPKDFLGGKARNAVLKHYGEVDVCITSPPYSEALSEKAGGGSKKNVLGVGITSDGGKQAQGAPAPYSTSEENIDNLPHGNIDAVITSPPYLKSAESGAGVNRQREGDVKIGCSTVGRTVAHPEAIDSTKEYGSIDTVITSPPYEGSLEGTTRHTRGGIASRDPALAQTGSYATVMSFGVPVGYSPSKDNIGNLKSSDEEYEALANGLMKNGRPTYLSEMLKVYGEMFKVLKPGGLAIIVVKPFVRNKKVVDLPYHTWILMAKVGFRLARLYKLRLFRLSFWRILQYKKHPDVPIIAHEYVLVCQKPGSEPGKPVEPKIDPLIFMAETAAKKQAAKIL